MFHNYRILEFTEKLLHNQIKKNIFLERYQYRLNLITNYIVFSYYKENKKNKLNSQININDLLLNLKFREIYSEKDIEILKKLSLNIKKD